MMTSIQEDRVKRFIKFLKKLPKKKFRFVNVVSEFEEVDENICGTVCCAVGWLPSFDPDKFKWHAKVYNEGCKSRFLGVPYVNGKEIENDVCDYFGMTSEEVEAIFYNLVNYRYDDDSSSVFDGFYGKTNGMVTKDDVIKALENLMKRHQEEKCK